MRTLPAGRRAERLELLEGAKHSLRQRREDVRRLLPGWFAGALASSRGGTAGRGATPR